MGNTKAYHIISVRHIVFNAMYMFPFTYLYKLIMTGYGKSFTKAYKVAYIYRIFKESVVVEGG